ncbi:Hsp70 family protein [Arthrobacter cheniae]|uniref:Hsp70 family protein n=1 Tax=Arthrobacter cheniae TaxID=1258888 RepID=A0A3A5M388_9MICC|nr:Hsp70 family protein [Arthrobacter cheniae]RJT80926.1 Hsp70 family protein [Arthrobacter cheniae]
MSYGLSIDVGTSFTAAAVIETGPQGLREPQVLALGSRASVIPTVVFIGQDGTRLVGEVAERRGSSQPERLAREFKRRIGDEVPLMVGDIAVLPQELFATVVLWVVDVAAERQGCSPESVTLTHPVGWGEHRQSLLRSALAEAGLQDVVLMTEPEAAALLYASREHIEGGTTLAVYDLGGGTFDATVVRKTGSNAFTVLGVPQGLERLGGADFDQEVFSHVINEPGVHLTDLDTSAPEVLAALSRLRRECAEAKEALSSDSEATISVMLPGAHSQVRLVRSELEAMIEPALGETVDTLRCALTSAQVDAEDLTAILLIGGSSRIPLVAQLLSAEFNRPLAVDLDPKASVALGAAFATAVLEEIPDQDEGLVPAAGTPASIAGEMQDGDALPHRVNRAGFSLHARKPEAVPRHGPAAMTPNRLIGVRVGAIAAAVALLGVATATAVNAPGGLAALSGFVANERAEAAEEPQPITPTELSPTPLDEARDGENVGPLAGPDLGQNFLERAGIEGAAPAPKDGDKGAEAEPSGSSDLPGRNAAKTTEQTEGGKATSDKAADGTPSGVGAAPAPSPSAAGSSASGSKPGTSPGDPTPPVPFPSTPAPTTPAPTTPVEPGPAPSDPTPTTPVDPPTTPVEPPPTPVDPTLEPPVVDPTTPVSPDPVTDPTTPPPAAEPPTVGPEPEPTFSSADPTPADPPSPGESSVASSSVTVA